MTRNAALGAIVVTLIFGLIVGCQPGGDRIAALERELADTKSKCGMETQELRAKLAETEPATTARTIANFFMDITSSNDNLTLMQRSRLHLVKGERVWRANFLTI